MILKITKRILIAALVLHIGTGYADNSGINGWEAIARLGGGAASAVAFIWAKDRLVACWRDVSANLNGEARRVPTFTEDIQNIAATGGCAAALLLTALGFHKDLPYYMAAVGVETTIMGGLFLGLKYGAGLKDMRLRHAMAGTVGIGAIRQGAAKYNVPHFSFGAPASFDAPVSRVIYGN